MQKAACAPFSDWSVKFFEVWHSAMDPHCSALICVGGLHANEHNVQLQPLPFRGMIAACIQVSQPYIDAVWSRCQSLRRLETSSVTELKTCSPYESSSEAADSHDHYGPNCNYLCPLMLIHQIEGVLLYELDTCDSHR